MILMGDRRRGASFGWVMAAPGDLDGDGNQDLAVSAPFEVNHGFDSFKIFPRKILYNVRTKC